MEKKTLYFSITALIFISVIFMYPTASALICNPNLPNGCPEEVTEINNINNSYINQSIFNTTFNSTQFDSTNPAHIDESWVSSLWCKLTGCTMTGNINFVNAGLNNTKFIQFNITATPETNQEGLLQWNPTDGTLDLGMDGGDITMQLGQEMFTKVRNAPGYQTINNSNVVYISGRTGVYPDVRLARSDNDSTAHVLGVATQDIPSPHFGYITTMGYVRGIKTDYTGNGSWGTTWAEGDRLYVSKTDAGILTNVEPTIPHHSDIVGTVGVISATQGSILVLNEKHYALEELTDVDGTPLTTTGQFPVWNQTGGYFDFNYNITDYLSTSTASSTYLTVDQTFPQTTTGTFYLPAVIINELTPFDNGVTFENFGKGGFVSSDGLRRAYFGGGTYAGELTDGTNTLNIGTGTYILQSTGPSSFDGGLITTDGFGNLFVNYLWSNGVNVIDLSSGILNDFSSINSVHWVNRILKGSAGEDKLDWQNDIYKPTTSFIINGSANVTTGLKVGDNPMHTNLVGLNVAEATGNFGAYISASYGATTQMFMGADTNGYGIIGTISNSDVVVRTNNQEQLRVDKTTGVMTGKGLSITNNINNAIYHERTDNAGAYVLVKNTNAGNVALAGMQMQTNSGTAYMFRTGSGYVTPNLRNALFYQNGGTNGVIFFTTQENLRLMPSGYNGFNNTNPLATVDIIGNLSVSRNSIFGNSTANVTINNGQVYATGNAGQNLSPIRLMPDGLVSQEFVASGGNAGALEQANNSLFYTPWRVRRTLVMAQEVVVVNTTVANTVTETTIYTQPHGADYLRVGKMEDIQLYGIISSLATGAPTANNLTVRVKYAGTTIGTFVIPKQTPALTNKNIEINIVTTVRAIGNGTTAIAVHANADVEGITSDPVINTVINSLDSTSQQNTTVTLQWSDADVGNTYTLIQGRALSIDDN